MNILRWGINMIIQHNMSAIHTMTQLGMTNVNLKKSTERLSSGYRVNRAADDAAALSISEKKLSQIRGLLRAARNAEDGEGFIQTGDGAMSQIADILQRMRELTVQSLNDVNTESDRAALQMEFDELQSEIDRINNQTEYNTNAVFEHYTDTYYKMEGNRVWSQDQIHRIDSSNNTLTVQYKIDDSSPEKTITFQIPAGEYTTQELIDEMDDVICAMGDAADGLALEYTDDGTCYMVLSDGEEITRLSGGLSYLFFDEYGGSHISALLGTTMFVTGYPLVVDENNNELQFTIERFDGTKENVSLTIDPGRYSREAMIDVLNRKLAGTGMTASEYGDYSIQIGGDDGIVTGLKGNMFKIDDASIGEPVRTSVFYDNTKYGSVVKTSAVFTGGNVLISRSGDTDYNKFTINSTNNVLKIRVDGSGSDPYIEVTLDDGEYTISEMKAHLQAKFDLLGVQATVGTKGPVYESSSTQNGNHYSYYGLKIQSKSTGSDSSIEFDVAGSTAYNTLFVDRTYTDEGKVETTTAGSFKYTKASLKSGRTYSTTDFPLTLTSANNQFQLKITEETGSGTQVTTSTNTSTISLTEKTYNSVNELVTEINNQINGSSAPMVIKDKLKVVNESGRIVFYPADGTDTVTKIAFDSTTTLPYSTGYDLLFVGKTTVYSTTPATSYSTSPKVTLDKMTEPIVLDSSNNRLQVSVGGADRTVTVPAGTYTKDELAAKITELLKGTTTTSPNTFSGYGTGTTTDLTKNYTASGKTNRTTISCNAYGTGDEVQGNTSVKGGTPATYTVPVVLGNTTTITGENNLLTMKINGTSYTVALDAGNYTPSQIAQSLNERLAAVTSEADAVSVTLENGKLKFTTVYDGSSRHLEFSTSTSTFLKSLSEKKTTASVTTATLQSSIVIPQGGSTLSMSINGARQTFTLDAGTYTPQTLVAHLNAKLLAAGADAVASLSGGKLCLTTRQANGEQSSIGLDTSNCGSAAEALFGQLVTKKPAQAVLSTPLKESVVMDSTNNEFKVRVTKNGASTDLAVTIPAGTYTRAELAAKLNELFGDEVDVALNNSNSLTFTTRDSGNQVSIRVNNSISGSAATALFGESTVTTPDVTASFDSDGHLVLTGDPSASSYRISVTPSQNSAFFKSTSSVQKTNPTATAGSVSRSYFTLKTNAAVPSSVTIADYNKELNFTYQSPSGTKTIQITFDEKTYTRAELAQAIQDKLDAELGTGECTVSVTAQRITIKENHYGSDYSMKNFSGGFYEYVMKGTAVRTSAQSVTNVAGSQRVSDTYIIGRKDVVNGTTKIQEDISDELSLDLTIDNTVYTLSMKLDAGEYSTQKLIDQIQKKLSEQLLAAGLPEQMILVDAGRFNTGVYGANDANALNFYLNSALDLPEGEYRIDGLSGNSLFQIFYKTEGELEPAYIAGSKDLSEGVTIEAPENEFSLDVDGVTYSYTIPEGEYTQEEFIDRLNDLFSAADNNGKTAMIKASLSGDCLMISYKQIGKHVINNVQGSAKTLMFYETEGRKDYTSALNLQIGANTDQSMLLERYSLSTLSMGINSVTISGYKYANKALDRIDKALEYLSEKRSAYGAKQNRLEYTIKGNDNTAENLQASESRDRDTDIADEMVQYSRSQILQQSASAMLAQAMRQGESVLALLEG